MRKPLFSRALLLASLCLPAAAWSAAPMRGGKLFGKVSPALAEAIHHTFSSQGFAFPGFKGLPPGHPALRPLASVLKDPEGFLTLDETARQAVLSEAVELARLAVQRKAADLVVLAAKEDRASLSEAVDGLGEIEDDYPLFLEGSQLKLVAALRGPAQEKLDALTLDKAGKTADALRANKDLDPTEGPDAVVKDTRREQAGVLLARIWGGRGKTVEYDESLAALVDLAKKGPNEGLERLILKDLIAHLGRAVDGRRVAGTHDYLALRKAILAIAGNSFFESSQLIAVRALAADAREGWRPNGTLTLKKLGELALTTRSRRVKSQTRKLLVDALNAPGGRDDDEANLELDALVARLSEQARARAEHDDSPWETQPVEKPFPLGRPQDISPRAAWLLVALFGALSLAGYLLKSPLATVGFLFPIFSLALVFGIFGIRDLGERRRLIALIGERLTRADRAALSLPNAQRHGLYRGVKLRGAKDVRPLKDLSTGELQALEKELKERETRPPLILDN